MKGKELADALEALIDNASLVDVVEELTTVCNNKAEHVRSNWQDENLARAWEMCAKQLDKCAAFATRTLP